MQYNEYLISMSRQSMSMNPDERPLVVWGEVTKPVYVRVTVAEGTPPVEAYKEIMNYIGYELLKILKQTSEKE